MMRRYAGARSETHNPKHSRAIFTMIPKSVETEVLHSNRSVEIPSDIPWELVWLTPEQANERHLTTLRRIAEVHGIPYSRLGYWSRCDNSSFPKPVAKLKSGSTNSAVSRLYPAAELVAWVRKQIELH